MRLSEHLRWMSTCCHCGFAQHSAGVVCPVARVWYTMVTPESSVGAQCLNEAGTRSHSVYYHLCRRPFLRSHSALELGFFGPFLPSIHLLYLFLLQSQLLWRVAPMFAARHTWLYTAGPLQSVFAPVCAGFPSPPAQACGVQP